MSNNGKGKEQLIGAAIDRGLGLAQYEGDEKIYGDVLKSFAKNHDVMLKRLKDAIGEDDIELAHRTAHSLSGAAGAIGATQLAHYAHCIEKALALMSNAGLGFIGGNAFAEQMISLEENFEAVFEELGVLVEKREDNSNGPVNMDREKTIELMDKLAPFLEIGDTKCLEYMDEIDEVFRPAAAGFGRFIDQMEHFDFEQAYETINDIRRFLMP